MKVQPIRTRIFKEGENLADFIVAHIPKLRDGAILAVTSKIVALAEGRVVQLKNKKEKEKLIRAESEWQLKVLPEWWLTVRDGTVVVNAGLDDSNADGKTILLPKDSFKSAIELRTKLKKRYKIKQLGIVITDSRTSALREGVTGVALGYAGFKGVKDYRGDKDIFGRKLKVTQTNIADSLATV
ncbi:MAG: coenzyme F420-0:L-glutamate ligase, partial [Patescibacteria group bacterium]